MVASSAYKAHELSRIPVLPRIPCERYKKRFRSSNFTDLVVSQLPTSSMAVEGRLKLSLIRTLEPVRRATYLLGIMPDWCRSVPKQRVAVFANGFGFCYHVFFVALSTTYFLFQFYMAVNESSIHAAIPVLVWSFCCIIMLYNQIYFYYRRKELIIFFRKWNSTDQQLSPYVNRIHEESEEKWKTRLNLMLIFFIAGFIPVVIILPYISEQRISYIYYTELRQIFTDPVLLIAQCISVVNVLTVQFMGEMVPALIYFHAAVIIRGLDEQMKRGFRVCVGYGSKKGQLGKPRFFERHFLFILTHYEEVSQLVIGTNRLFGFPLFTCHAAILSWLVLQTYSLLKNFSNISWIELFVIFTNLSVAALRISVTVLISNNFQTASAGLKSTTNKLLSHHMTVLRKHEYSFVKNVLLHMSANSVLVSPSNLYIVNRCLLLKMFGIVVSYNLILLQS